MSTLAYYLSTTERGDLGRLSADNKLHLTYLERTARYLITLMGNETKYGGFNVRYWWREETWEDAFRSCNTSGCTIGQMIHMFPECGLKLEITSGDDPMVQYTVAYDRYSGGPALMHYFSMLSSDEVHCLFGTSSYSFLDMDKPQRVGQRILDLLDRKGLLQNVEWKEESG